MAARKLAVKLNQSKAIAYGEMPPAQGVFGDARLVGVRHGDAACAGSGQFRPSGRRLSEFAGTLSDPADCALQCERDRRCRAWSFNYPTDIAGGAICWLKSNVPPRSQDNCCISGVRGAGVVEPRNGGTETSIDRFGGDYRSFELKAATATMSARRPARPTTNAGPGPLRGRVMPEKPRTAS